MQARAERWLLRSLFLGWFALALPFAGMAAPRTAGPPEPSGKGQVEIAVLEEQADTVPPIGQNVNWEKKVYRTQVRLVFRHMGGEWLPYDQNFFFLDNQTTATVDRLVAQLSNSTRSWHMVREGMDLGEIRSSGLIYGEQTPCTRGWIQPLTGNLKSFPPKAGPQIEDFSGWVGIPVRRPILLLPHAYKGDPEGWVKLGDKSTSIPQEVFSEFIRVPDKGIIIPSPKTGLGHDDDYNYWKNRVFYSISDLETRSVFGSRKGDFLYCIQFRRNAPVDQENDPSVRAYCFGWCKGAAPRYVGTMLPLEIGDFDGDGKSDFLFWYTNEDEDGYVLVWDRFAKRAKSTWNYH